MPVAFQLNFTAGGYNAGFALALQEGIYKRPGLDVTIVKGQGSGVTAQLVASGKADIAYADALAVMQLIAKGAPMKVVSTIYQSNPNAVTVLSRVGDQVDRGAQGPVGGGADRPVPDRDDPHPVQGQRARRRATSTWSTCPGTP